MFGAKCATSVSIKPCYVLQNKIRLVNTYKKNAPSNKLELDSNVSIPHFLFKMKTIHSRKKLTFKLILNEYPNIFEYSPFTKDNC